MERETGLPKSVTKGLIAAAITLLSLGTLVIGEYSTGKGSSPGKAAGKTPQTEASAAPAEETSEADSDTAQTASDSGTEESTEDIAVIGGADGPTSVIIAEAESESEK